MILGYFEVFLCGLLHLRCDMQDYCALILRSACIQSLDLRPDIASPAIGGYGRGSPPVSQYYTHSKLVWPGRAPTPKMGYRGVVPVQPIWGPTAPSDQVGALRL